MLKKILEWQRCPCGLCPLAFSAPPSSSHSGHARKEQLTNAASAGSRTGCVAQVPGPEVALAGPGAASPRGDSPAGWWGQAGRSDMTGGDEGWGWGRPAGCRGRAPAHTLIWADRLLESLDLREGRETSRGREAAPCADTPPPLRPSSPGDQLLSPSLQGQPARLPPAFCKTQGSEGQGSHAPGPGRSQATRRISNYVRPAPPPPPVKRTF